MGLYFSFFLSLDDMQQVLKRFISVKRLNYVFIGIFILTGFGIYLGRFLRYNSWKILQNSLNLFNDIINIVIHPKQYFEAWLFTLRFALFLGLSYLLFKNIKKTNS